MLSAKELLERWEDQKGKWLGASDKAILLKTLFEEMAEGMGSDSLDQAAAGLACFFEDMREALDESRGLLHDMATLLKANGGQEAGKEG
jgi:hypothetical protein